MTGTTIVDAPHVIVDSEIRPGDCVTILLYSDWFTRTSIVAEDGFSVGCGAVEDGRARIVSIRHGWTGR